MAIFMGSPARVQGQGLTVGRVAALEELEQAEIIRVATLINVAPAVAEPADVYESQCKVCHGASGKGDGVAAVAYNPKPADFTDAAFATSRTLDQVVAVIRDGKLLLARGYAMCASLVVRFCRKVIEKSMKSIWRNFA